MTRPTRLTIPNGPSLTPTEEAMRYTRIDYTRHDCSGAVWQATPRKVSAWAFDPYVVTGLLIVVAGLCFILIGGW